MKNKQNIGVSVSGGMFWSFLERIAAQAVSVIVGIILARLLTPDEYGIIAIVMIFITLCDVFVTAGFGTALVQKKEVSSLDYDTAFWLSFLISIVLYIFLFFAAPYIAVFYELDMLTPIIRIFGLRLIMTSLNSIQIAKVQREMTFKKYFLATITGTVASCVIGVVMAYSGYGVWSLVAQYLSNTLVSTFLFSLVCGWMPKIQFSFRKAKEIFRFGSKVLGANLVNTGVLELQSVLVGKCFGAADLAILDQGKKYPSLLVNNVNSSISKVMLPVFSKKQSHIDILKSELRRTVKISNFILCPLLLGFCAVAPTFVEVFLTSKWSACIPYIQIFCLMYLTRPLTMICHQILLAIDKAGVAMGLMVVINAVALGGTLVSALVLKNMFFAAVSLLMADIVSLIGFMIAMRVYLAWNIKEQLLDVLPPLVLSIVMLLFVFGFPYLVNLSGIVLFLLQMVIGAIIYLGLSTLFRIDSFTWLLQKVYGFLKKSKEN